VLGSSAPCDRIDDDVRILRVHYLPLCEALLDKTDPQSKAYEWLSLMAIALAIAKQSTIPCKYGDGYGAIDTFGRIAVGRLWAVCGIDHRIYVL